MTALFYSSISSDLTEDEIIQIDKKVKANREAVCIFVRDIGCNGKDKIKRLILVISLTSLICFSSLESAEAIGLNMPPTQIVKVQSSYQRYQHDSKVQIAKVIPRKKDLIAYKSPKEILFLMYLTDPRLSSNQQVLELVKELRGGSGNHLGIAAFLVVIILILAMGEGFVPNNLNPGWGLDRPNPFQPPTAEHRYPPVYDLFFPRRTPDCPRPGSTLQINRPTAMPHEEFVGLTKEERRALPHSNDMKIIHEGRPELEVGFWQSKFKVGDHGAVHDLSYTIKANGGTKTEKTDDNALKMMRSIVDMPNRDNVRWFEDGTYQGGTDRGFEAIHIYDLDKQVIAVFKKSTGKFVTTCQLTEKEDAELKATGNFGGGKGWYSGQVRNLPPEQITPVNTFESEVMGMTPMTSMDENSSPNQGFTPINSFENDIMGITPIENSQVDN
jgi:hypothetical protein